MIAARKAVAVAFDGLIADTLPARSSAVVEGIATVGFAVSFDTVMSIIAGRTIPEAVRAAMFVSGIIADETSIDIATHRASRMVSEWQRATITLSPNVRHWLARCSMHARLMVRADSDRSLVELVLEHGDLSAMAAVVICGNDFGPSMDTSMFVQSWTHLISRCTAWGIATSELRGLECASEELSAPMDAVRIHRVTSVTEATVGGLELS